ncbi:uncharacterized protein LOC115634115 [Scaptodrosophila lebanonensis]|uniref:Uncharacterized protein LOC115634115 n=1 Tax=Drosophila lebanonensis TaxID=7225 RepID=A0A6J2UGH6_DROLE|nr:uncharacterized protein LOC115634115 [Scaptodrosophila lebanonensis]
MLCAVSDCLNHFQEVPNLGTFEFPKDPEVQEQWVLFCNREVDTEVERVCEEHFTPVDFDRDSKCVLLANAVPSVYKDDGQEHEDEFLQTGECDPEPKIKHSPNNDMVTGISDSPLPDQYENGHETAIENEECGSTLAEEYEQERQAILVSKRKQIVNALLDEYDRKQGKTQTQNTSGSHEVYDEVESTKTVVIDADAYLSALEQENTELKRINFKMKLAEEDNVKAMGKLQKKLEKAEGQYSQLCNRLQTIFSSAQIDKIQHNKRIVWPESDLVDACALYAASSRVYDMLLRKNFPLPSIRTLQFWDARQRERLVDDNDPDADCTIHHWRCTHRAQKAAHRKDLRMQEQQKHRDSHSKPS